MYNLIFIEARGGQTMSQKLVEVIRDCPEGSTIKQLSQRVNRPVSMINIYLKDLISAKQVKVRVQGMQRWVYPRD